MSLMRTRCAIAIRQGQVATYLMVWITVLVVLGLLILNLGRVAILRTSTAVAADTATMGLASSLGSLALKLCNYLDPAPAGQTTRCRPKCTDNGEFVLHIIIGAVLIAIAIIITIITWGGTSWLLAMVIVVVVASVVAVTGMVVQAAVIVPHQMQVFADQFNDFTMHDQFRESSLLTAFLLTVDDQNQVVDNDPDPLYADINQNGDKKEMVGAFSKWYYGRLQLLRRNDTTARRISTLIDGYLTPFRPLISNEEYRPGRFGNPTSGFRFFLGNPDDFAGARSLIGVLGWIEGLGLGYDLPWWQPGYQGATVIGRPGGGTPCNPDDDSCNTLPVNAIAFTDEVDWVNGEIPPAVQGPLRRDELEHAIDGSLSAFEQYIDMVQTLTPQQRIKTVEQWADELKDWKLDWYSDRFAKWIRDLTDIKRDMCARFPAPLYVPPCMPLGTPVTGPIAGITGNPIDWSIAQISDFKDLVDSLRTPLQVTVLGRPPAKDVIYKWRDKRGGHVVRVYVDDFKVPKMKKKTMLVPPWVDARCGLIGACIQTCVIVKNKRGDVSVHVSRLDQDQQVSPAWALRVNKRGTAAPVNWGVTELDLDYWRGVTDQFAIKSTAKASYTWLRRGIQMKETK